MTKEECQQFILHGKRRMQVGSGDSVYVPFLSLALALAMDRDGSSGGVIRMATINKDGVERKVFSGAQLPHYWKD
jgi:20S proteasome subunit beta 1